MRLSKNNNLMIIITVYETGIWILTGNKVNQCLLMKKLVFRHKGTSSANCINKLAATCFCIRPQGDIRKNRQISTAVRQTGRALDQLTHQVVTQNYGVATYDAVARRVCTVLCLCLSNFRVFILKSSSLQHPTHNTLCLDSIEFNDTSLNPIFLYY